MAGYNKKPRIALGRKAGQEIAIKSVRLVRVEGESLGISWIR